MAPVKRPRRARLPLLMSGSGRYVHHPRRDPEAITRLATQIYCTWLSLGKPPDLRAIVTAAIELYDEVHSRLSGQGGD